jgi:hypothetical protein
MIDLTENVQRDFTKRLPSLSSLPYTERLALLDLDLLELRRHRFDLICYYKVLNNLTPFDPNEVFSVYTPSSWSKSEMPYLQKPIKATNRVLSTIFFRGIDAWHALPAAMRSSSSLPVFKRHLKQFDPSTFLKGSARETVLLSANAVRAGVDILVGTPGRILDLIRHGNLDLSQLNHVVLDEVDHMLDMGFADDVDAILKERYSEGLFP